MQTIKHIILVKMSQISTKYILFVMMQIFYINIIETSNVKICFELYFNLFDFLYLLMFLFIFKKYILIKQ